MVGVVRDHFQHQDVYNYRLNENSTIVPYGEDPADFKQDVLTPKAIDFVDRRAPKAQPFFLWLTYTAPHEGGWGGEQMDYCTGITAKPAPRHAHTFDSEPLPRPPNFNEYDVSDKPAEIRNRPLFGPSLIAGFAHVPLPAGLVARSTGSSTPSSTESNEPSWQRYMRRSPRSKQAQQGAVTDLGRLVGDVMLIEVRGLGQRLEVEGVSVARGRLRGDSRAVIRLLASPADPRAGPCR